MHEGELLYLSYQVYEGAGTNEFMKEVGHYFSKASQIDDVPVVIPVHVRIILVIQL